MTQQRIAIFDSSTGDVRYALLAHPAIDLDAGRWEIPVYSADYRPVFVIAEPESPLNVADCVILHLYSSPYFRVFEGRTLKYQKIWLDPEELDLLDRSPLHRLPSFLHRIA